MRNFSARARFMSGSAIAAAVLWGLAEFVALQWSSLAARWRTQP